ncbi:CHRD domain-containing protein [soil metagenome]
MRCATMCVSAAVLCAFSGATHAAVVALDATLLGSSERPNPNASPAQGLANITVDTLTGAFTMNMGFANLLGTVTMSHFHSGSASVSGPVFFNLDGMNANPALNPTSGGVTLGVSAFGGIITGNFPLAQLENLLTGNVYINVHSTVFGGGEIRGQLIPTPGAMGLLGAAGLLAARRRRPR